MKLRYKNVSFRQRLKDKAEKHELKIAIGIVILAALALIAITIHGIYFAGRIQ